MLINVWLKSKKIQEICFLDFFMELNLSIFFKRGKWDTPFLLRIIDALFSKWLTIGKIGLKVKCPINNQNTEDVFPPSVIFL